MNKPLITAHSGCDDTLDGSIEAILTGIALGADDVEVDVRHVEGFGLMLAHDQVADPSGLVALKTAFAIIAEHPKVGINCDLKTYGLVHDVLNLAESMRLDASRIALSGSLTPAELRRDPSIARRARVCLNIEEALCELMLAGKRSDLHPWDVVRGQAGGPLCRWIDLLIESLNGLGIEALNLPPRPFIAEHLARLGESGVRISAWTINEEEAMRTLIALPYLVNLTTRRVALAMSVRRQIIEGGTKHDDSARNVPHHGPQEIL